MQTRSPTLERVSMKILIPTAKEMNEKQSSLGRSQLMPKSQAIIEELLKFSVKELETLYKISPQMAEIEYQRIQNLSKNEAETYPALLLFDGLMYRNIKRKDWTQGEKSYIQEHLLLTSSLYGVIPALSPIAPHRLDFLVGLKPNGQTLKKFWREDYTKAVADEDMLLSLLSSEFEEVFDKSVRDKMLRFKFLEEKAGKFKSHSTISKKARGQFLTALMEAQVDKLEQIKQLSFAGFAFRADLSDDKEFVFVKEE